MDSLKVSTMDDDEDEDGLDPRIQIELEKLNSATDVINKLEMQLDEANTTFRMLMNDSTRRLKASSSKLGASIVRARPYYEALELSKRAQQECQRAAVKFQRANEIHQAAKETVALAEARFLSKQHEWQFDNAWQEMLNHATIKVTEAENQKSESGREHQKRALLFNAAEQKVQLLEQRLKRSIEKSRPYFEEKAALQTRLDSQKQCISHLEAAVQRAKADYAASLQRLEQISEEIHQRRKDKSGTATPRGPREPGVGAELEPVNMELPHSRTLPLIDSFKYDGKQPACIKDNLSFDFDLDSCDVRSVDSVSRATSSAVSEADDLETDPLEEDLEELKQRVRELAVRDNVSHSSDSWENELTATIDKLDNALLMHECEMELRESCGVGSVGAVSGDAGFFSGSSSAINSICGVSGQCDVDKSSDVVDTRSSDNCGDVANNSNSDDAATRSSSNSRNVDEESSDVVTSTNDCGDVVTSSSDNCVNVVNNSSSDDVVTRSSNNSCDVFNRCSDVDKQGDVVTRSSNNSGDATRSSNIVNRFSDVVNRRSGIGNDGDIVNNSSTDDVVTGSFNNSDNIVNKGDFVDRSIDVCKESDVINKDDDVVNRCSDVVERSSDVVNKSDVFSRSRDVVNEGDVVEKDVVSRSRDVVNKDVVNEGRCCQQK